VDVTALFKALPWQEATIAALLWLVYRLVMHITRDTVPLAVWQEHCASVEAGIMRIAERIGELHA
jgi:hypothetical protein